MGIKLRHMLRHRPALHGEDETHPSLTPWGSHSPRRLCTGAFFFKLETDRRFSNILGPRANSKQNIEAPPRLNKAPTLRQIPQDEFGYFQQKVKFYSC